jgi:CelD/BcsL family acetyltransferase involved in cellulose biosynthesis
MNSAAQEFLLRGKAGMAEIQSQWWTLWRQSETQDPFTRPDWIAAHVDCFEDEGRFFLACAGERDSLLAVVPLIHRVESFHGLPVRKLRAAANAHTFRVNPLCHSSADPRLLADAILSSIEKNVVWDVLELPSVPDPGFGEYLELAAQNRGLATLSADTAGSMFIPLDHGAGGDQPWFAALSSRMRSKLRKHLQLAQKQLGAVRLQRMRDPDSHYLELFYKIEASGWKGRSHTAIACHRQTRRFYDSIAASFSQTGSFYLDILWAGEKPVAGSFGVTYRHSFLPLKWCYDEQFEHFTPGNLLVAELLRAAWQDGCRVFDISPAAAYKKRWTHSTCPAKHYYIFRGPYGRLLHAYKARLRPAAKSLLQRFMHSQPEPSTELD